MNWKAAFVLVACAAALVAQTPPVTILDIEIENFVAYYGDVTDPSKLATSASIVPPPSAITFKWMASSADIVAINGKPAKGTVVGRHLMFRFTPDYAPGRMIADFTAGAASDISYVIVQPDGTEIGIITSSGFCAAAIPPGAPAAATSGQYAVTGGIGAFLGVRGQVSTRSLVGGRAASMLEDPANRRTHGGGKLHRYIHLIPATWPEVMALPTGPAIFHADDFSPVTAEKPARAGELLMMSVSGLGPVKPNLDPGKPFPAWQTGKEHQVNSPVEVTVNGKAAAVTSAIGWPGMNNVYRVDFRVPEGTAAGTATLGLSVAWINGPEVKIPVR